MKATEATKMRTIDTPRASMASTSHRDRWLLNAEDAVGSDTDAQIVWLREKRKEYAPLVDAGDFEVRRLSGDGGSSDSIRGVSDEVNHDAIVAAIRYLGGTEIGSTGAMLHPVFTPSVG